jgi:hypothetical protein
LSALAAKRHTRQPEDRTSARPDWPAKLKSSSQAARKPQNGIILWLVALRGKAKEAKTAVAQADQPFLLLDGTSFREIKGRELSPFKGFVSFFFLFIQLSLYLSTTIFQCCRLFRQH